MSDRIGDTSLALVGRDLTLDSLQRLLAGEGAVVVLGIPGAGKTALLDVVAGAEDSAGSHVLRMAGRPSERDLPYAAEEVLGVARRAKMYGMPPRTFLNVSIPAMPQGGYKGYIVTRLANQHGGEESYAETKHPGTERTVYWNVYKENPEGGPEGTDVWAVANGYVSVTPMKLGETDESQMTALNAWFK